MSSGVDVMMRLVRGLAGVWCRAFGHWPNDRWARGEIVMTRWPFWSESLPAGVCARCGKRPA